MTPRALRAGGAFIETDQRLTFLVALHAPRLGSTRHEAPAEPDSSYMLPVKGAHERESETPSSYRASYRFRDRTNVPCGMPARFESHFVLSLLDSARSESHPFAFAPSRDASADAGFRLGLAA